MFLQPDQHPFLHDDPWGTIFLQRQHLYRIVHLTNNVLHCDFVELFYAPANAQLLLSDIVPKISCRYTGTYLLRVTVDIDNRSSSASVSSPLASGSTHPLSPVNQAARATSHSSHFSRVFNRGSSSNMFRSISQRQVSLLNPLNSTVPPHTTPTVPTTLPFSSQAPTTDFCATAVHRNSRDDDDTDSDDSTHVQVKRVKDSELHVKGKTYRVQGKTNVYSIIIASTSM